MLNKMRFRLFIADIEDHLAIRGIELLSDVVLVNMRFSIKWLTLSSAKI